MRTRASVLFVAAVAFCAAHAVAGSAQSAGAAPTANPFAGTWSGTVPVPAGEWTPGWSDAIWPITVSKNGSVSGSYEWVAQYGSYDRKGSLSGSVDASGWLSVRVRESRGSYDSIDGASYPAATRSFRVTAALVCNADGNLVGTTSDGTTFTWLRQ